MLATYSLGRAAAGDSKYLLVLLGIVSRGYRRGINKTSDTRIGRRVRRRRIGYRCKKKGGISREGLNII